MKVFRLLLTATLAVFIAAAPAMAMEGQPADAKAQKAEVKKKVKPHSHLEEKTGVPVKANEKGEAMPESKKTDAKKQQHLHPRDGK